MSFIKSICSNTILLSLVFFNIFKDTSMRFKNRLFLDFQLGSFCSTFKKFNHSFKLLTTACLIELIFSSPKSSFLISSSLFPFLNSYLHLLLKCQRIFYFSPNALIYASKNSAFLANMRNIAYYGPFSIPHPEELGQYRFIKCLSL